MTDMQALGKSIGARLSRLAREKQVAYEKILTAFLIERMVARITTNSELGRHVIFKGGYVTLRTFGSPRFTIDLDAVVHKLALNRTIEHLRQVIESTDLHDGVWFRFESHLDLKLQNEYGGTRMIFRAGLGEVLKDLARAQIVNFDIGRGDPVVPAPLDSQLNQLLGDGGVSWRVYTCESIFAEKIHALVRGNFQSE